MGYSFTWIEVVLFAIGLYTLPAGVTGCCTDGFHSLQQLMSATETASAPDQPLLGLHPALRITCGGKLTEIIYTTTIRGSTGQESFIVWRETSPGTNVYYAVRPLISRRTETLLAMVTKDTALYSVKSNFSVFSRDFIGFVAFVPSTLRFLNLKNAASGSIYKSAPFPDTIDLRNVTFYNRYSPLITVVIAPSSVPCSNTQLPTPTKSITSSIILPTNPSQVTSSAIFTVTLSPTPSSINPTSVFTSTIPSAARSSKTVLIATVAIVSGGVIVCLTLLLLSVTALCVTCAVRSRNKERCKLGQSSSTEHALSDIRPEVVNHADNMYAQISTMESGNSADGDNCSMESNPTYGDHCNDGHIHPDKSTTDENKYHTLEFEQTPAGEQEEHVIKGHSNYYHTLQHLNHKPKYDYESEYCSLTDISNYIDAAGVPTLEGSSSACVVTTLEPATAKSGADKENEYYDIPNTGHKHMILKSNICYNLKPHDV